MSIAFYILYGVSLVLASIYFLYIYWLSKQWQEDSIPTSISSISVTVLIPFRNERDNLPALLETLKNQNHTSLEVLFINDNSDDSGESWLSDNISDLDKYKIISLTNVSGKKAALTEGVSQAQNNLIVCLDADCNVPKGWLQSICSTYETSPFDYLILPVKFDPLKNNIHRLQAVEFVMLVSSGLASIKGKKALMSNGANVAFTKTAFNAVDGFKNNFKYASGDDLFLLFKMEAKQMKIRSLIHRDVLAKTSPVESFRSFLAQRVRWASKTSAYQSSYAKKVAFLIGILNVFLLFSILLLLVNCQTTFVALTLILFLLKYSIDFFFLQKVSGFYYEDKLVLPSIWISLLYPFYVTLLMILSLFYKPKWKGRSIYTNLGEK